MSLYPKSAIRYHSLLILLAVLIGIGSGLGAVLFRYMIGFIHNLFFYGKFSGIYDANIHSAASSWGIGIILVPILGGLIVTWITTTFAPEAKGHGVPEVVDAIFFNSGKIRPIVVAIKAIASSISIGTGGSLGREGPIIQMGAAFGATLGEILKLPTKQLVVLVAAGAAGGIAATFNAPIGGILFAMELLLIEINAANLLIVVISTIIACFIGHRFFGLMPAFSVRSLITPLQQSLSTVQLLLFVPLGVFLGAAATFFIKFLYDLEDFFEKIVPQPYLRQIIGTFILGSLFFGFYYFAGHYYIQGIGYATIQDVLTYVLTNPWFLLLLFGAKLFATALTLSAGGSGGIFSPSLFLGATLGAAYGCLINHFIPELTLFHTVFAIAGMAAMVGSTTGAALTAIIMTFEMTGDYGLVLPATLTTMIAYFVRQCLFQSDSIYNLKLTRRGRKLREGLRAATKSIKPTSIK